MSYSQNNEEQLLLEYFGDRKGRLLDIGAYDGKELSNSLALIERGWGGVLVEPSPTKFLDLAKLHHGRDNITLINGAVSDRVAFVPFHFNHYWASTITDSPYYSGNKDHPFKHIYAVQTIDVANIMIQWGPFDFVNIDAEGEDMRIAKAIADICHDGSIKAMCVEWGSRDREEWLGILKDIGLGRFEFNGENIIGFEQ